MASTMPHGAFGGTVSALVKNDLFMPNSQTILAGFVIAAGQVLQAGAILGVIAASGELVLSNASASDGSEVPFAILIEDLDTTAGAQTFPVAVEGSFNPTALVYGPGHTADTVLLPLSRRRIILDVPRYSYA